MPAKKILVCFDGSESAQRALEKGERLIDENDGEIVVLHVAEVFTDQDGVDLITMINPLEHELRHLNNITEREKAKQVQEKFEQLYNSAPSVTVAVASNSKSM